MSQTQDFAHIFKLKHDDSTSRSFAKSNGSETLNAKNWKTKAKCFLFSFYISLCAFILGKNNKLFPLLVTFEWRHKITCFSIMCVCKWKTTSSFIFLVFSCGPFTKHKHAHAINLVLYDFCAFLCARIDFVLRSSFSIRVLHSPNDHLIFFESIALGVLLILKILQNAKCSLGWTHKSLP